MPSSGHTPGRPGNATRVRNYGDEREVLGIDAMQKEQPTLSGFAAAFLTVSVFLGATGWLVYCVHFAPADSWQKQVFSGEGGVLAILWLVVLMFPMFIVGVLRLKHTADHNNIAIAVAKHVGGYAVAVGMVNSAFLNVSGPISGVLTIVWLSGIILFAVSEFILRRRSNKVLRPTPTDASAER